MGRFAQHQASIPKTHPTVRWAAMNKSIFACREKQLKPDEDIFEGWPAEVDPSLREATADSDSVPMDGVFCFEDMSGLINLASGTLREVLEDSPVVGTGADSDVSDGEGNGGDKTEQANWNY